MELLSLIKFRVRGPRIVIDPDNYCAGFRKSIIFRIDAMLNRKNLLKRQHITCHRSRESFEANNNLHVNSRFLATH